MRLVLFTMVLLALTSTLEAQERGYGKATTLGTTTRAGNATSEVSSAQSYSGKLDLPIQLYFDNFRVRRTLGGQTYCQMTFYVKNNGKTQLDSLATGVKWPGIATKLSFENVKPGGVTTLKYALVGPGCYTMGQKPTLDISLCYMRARMADGKIVDVPFDICKSMVTFL